MTAQGIQPFSNNPREPERSGDEMCAEVAHELNEQYVEGMISREDAERIINRCYKLYGSS